MPTQVRSYSKINLGLAIGPPRADGFHALATVYQTLALHDLVSVTAARAVQSEITLTTNDVRVPVDHHNTAWRMVAAALDQMGVQARVEIHIEKRLPVQGGLGAGSANAAAALVGLEKELALGVGRQLSVANRLASAAQIGSDVPLFLIGGAVLGVGRGEEVSPLPDLPPTWCVVAAPPVGVSTPQAFKDWDALHLSADSERIEAGLTGSEVRGSGLTSGPAFDRLKRLSRSLVAAWNEPHSSGVSALGGGLAEDPLLALVRTGIENDFEEVVFPQYPLLGNIKRILANSASPGDPEDEALYAALSGSGSALFGLYRTETAAKRAHDRVLAFGVDAFLTMTSPREEYWREMLVQD